MSRPDEQTARAFGEHGRNAGEERPTNGQPPIELVEQQPAEPPGTEPPPVECELGARLASGTAGAASPAAGPAGRTTDDAQTQVDGLPEPERPAAGIPVQIYTNAMPIQLEACARAGRPQLYAAQLAEETLDGEELLSPTGFYLELKSRSEDSRSNRSITTSKSTRQIFDLMARLLPVGVLLLVLLLMLHFVLYVRDLEPYKSISEVACKALAASVIPLSVVFILRIICDCNRTYTSDYDAPLSGGGAGEAQLYAYAELPAGMQPAVAACGSGRLVQVCVPVVQSQRPPPDEPAPSPTPAASDTRQTSLA